MSMDGAPGQLSVLVMPVPEPGPSFIPSALPALPPRPPPPTYTHAPSFPPARVAQDREMAEGLEECPGKADEMEG